MLTSIIQTAFFIFIFMTTLFIIAQIKKDNSIADIGWGLGFICIAYLNLFLSPKITIIQLLTSLLITLWGLRLAIYIFIRNKDKAEDIRYAQWRKSWGKRTLFWGFLQVFMLQGLIMLLISLPIIIINSSVSTGQINIISFIGIVVWLIGMSIETTADYQLYIFLKNPDNTSQVMDKGLWYYSRHPNYFGELLNWLGIFLIALTTSYSWLLLISPLTIAYILFLVSAPITEQQFNNNVAYQEYKKRTSAIILLPPKKQF